MIRKLFRKPFRFKNGENIVAKLGFKNKKEYSEHFIKALKSKKISDQMFAAGLYKWSLLQSNEECVTKDAVLIEILADIFGIGIAELESDDFMYKFIEGIVNNVLDQKVRFVIIKLIMEADGEII
jgi:hypothetical protein